MKRFFEVVWKVTKAIIIGFCVCALCLLSVGVCGFLLISIIPVLSRIIGWIMVALGLLMLIVISVAMVVFYIKKGMFVYKYSLKHTTDIKQTWDSYGEISKTF